MHSSLGALHSGLLFKHWFILASNWSGQLLPSVQRLISHLVTQPLVLVGKACRCSGCCMEWHPDRPLQPLGTKNVLVHISSMVPVFRESEVLDFYRFLFDCFVTLFCWLRCGLDLGNATRIIVWAVQQFVAPKTAAHHRQHTGFLADQQTWASAWAKRSDPKYVQLWNMTKWLTTNIEKRC